MDIRATQSNLSNKQLNNRKVSIFHFFVTIEISVFLQLQ